MRLSEGGDLRKYYPLSEAARPEYEGWRAARMGAAPAGGADETPQDGRG